MKSVDKFSTMLKLLKLVNERRHELPNDDEEFGPAILRLIANEIDVSDVLAKPLKSLAFSGLTQKHYHLLVNMGMITIASVICIHKELLPIVEDTSFHETYETILENVARTVSSLFMTCSDGTLEKVGLQDPNFTLSGVCKSVCEKNRWVK